MSQRPLIAVVAAAATLLGAFVLAPVLLLASLGGTVQSVCGKPTGTTATAIPDHGIAGLDEAQTGHAATIIGVGRRLGILNRGILIALTTASQESGFRIYANDGHGSDLQPEQLGVRRSLRLPHDAVGTDHGSLGLFQQQWPWWGTLRDLMDPATSARLFYQALLEVPRWQRLSVPEAAQAVQRSAHPDAYADDQATATLLLTRLGNPRTVPAQSVAPASTGSSSGGRDYHLGPVTPQLTALVRLLAPRFGITSVGGWRATATDMAGHPAGLAADFMVASRGQGSRLAAFARAHATELGVDYIIWWQRIWSLDRADAGWRPMPDRGSQTANHRDHVHISIRADATPATGQLGSTPSAGIAAPCTQQAQTPATGVVYPIPKDADYVDQRNYGDTGPNWSAPHTGTDLAAACGTAVRAATAGRVLIDRDNAWAGRWLVMVQVAPGDLTTWYAHLQRLDVTHGQPVNAGQQIGSVGREGNATGCHLHFEVHPDGGGYGEDDIDPTRWLRDHVGSTVTVSGPRRPPAPAGSRRITLLVYNIHVGASHGRELHRVAADIARSRADLVLLNEVDRYRPAPSQATRLGTRLGMYAAYGPNARWGPKQRGNAILSRYPIIRATNTRLPWRPGTERRGLLAADIDIHGNPIRVYTSHLQPRSAVRLTQAGWISRRIGLPRCTTFFGGDMNSTPAMKEGRALDDHLNELFGSGRFGSGATKPGPRPTNQIDQLWHSAHAVPLAARIMPRWTSDHRAIRARFAIPPAAACR